MDYTPLVKGEIRLLTILPNPVISEAIHCELGNFAFTGQITPSRTDENNGDPLYWSTSFVALSYTWGASTDRAEIFVAGKVVQVQSNLKKALRALQRLESVKAGCKIWADALCLNQDDVDELNQEIPRMRSIYRSAVCVAIWLGEASDNSDEAFDFINSISKAWDDGSEAVAKYVRDIIPYQLTTISAALTGLARRGFWSRVWIIQELTFGSITTPVLCGEKSTTWERLLNVCHHLRPGESRYRQPVVAKTIHDALQLAGPRVYDELWRNQVSWEWEKYEEFRSLQEAQASDSSVPYQLLLSRCRGSDCTNPADKVYGMLGLLSPAVSNRLSPNYNLPLREVYRGFAKAWIEGERSLDILLQCGDEIDETSNCLELPSWTPNLRVTKRMMTSNFEPNYFTHGGTDASASFSPCGNVLFAKGLIMDELDGLSGRRCWEDDLNNVKDMVDSRLHISAYGGDAEHREALWRALLGNRNRSGGTARRSYGRVLDSAILDHRFHPPVPTPWTGDSPESRLWNWHLFWTRNSELRFGNRQLKEHLDDFGTQVDDDHDYKEALRRAGDFMWNKRLASTKSGFITIVPCNAACGDVVAVLFGCSCPLLLRKQNSTYRSYETYEIISHCYVQGIMEGEAVNMYRNGVYELKDIAIS